MIKTKTLRLSSDLEVPLSFATEGVAAIGMRGSGKSNTLRRWAELCHKAGIPFVAIDPKGDWYGIKSSRDGKSAGLPVAVFGGLYEDFPLTETMGAQIADLLVDQNMSAVLDISRLSIGARGRFLTSFCNRLMDRHQREPHVRCVILEEAHRYIPQQIPPELRACKEACASILLEGRAFGLGCWVASQRPARLHKDVLEEVGTAVIHRIGAAATNDLRTVRKWVEHEDLGPEIGVSLTKLADGEAWVLAPSTLGIAKKVQVDRMETFDSAATPLVGAGSRPVLTMADVNEAAIKEALVEAVAAAKENDPAELRKRLAAAQKRIREFEVWEPPPPVVVEGLPPALSKRLVLSRDIMLERAKALIDDMKTVCDVVDEAIALKAEDATVIDLPRPKLEPPLPADPSHGGGLRKPPAVTPAPAPNGGVGKGETLILSVVCSFGATGTTPEAITVMTGYKKTSRNTYLQRLSSAGLIDRVSGRIVGTDAGRAHLGPEFVPMPTSGGPLRAFWLAKLSGGEKAIFQVLVDNRGQWVPMEIIDESTGYKKTSRNTYLQRLAAREIVERVDGQARAAGMLF